MLLHDEDRLALAAPSALKPDVRIGLVLELVRVLHRANGADVLGVRLAAAAALRLVDVDDVHALGLASWWTTALTLRRLRA